MTSDRHDTDARDISAEVPDWSRERCRRFWDPGRRLLRSIRRYQAWRARGPFGRALARACVVPHRFWSAVAGADIPLDARLGGGLLLPHPNGVVIHPDAVVGPNCLIFQQVTLGQGGPKPGAPVLGGHVDVGAGAKVLGGVHVGDHARIGANAVVLDDVPAGATAVGVPARVIVPAG
jgi:serine O-acetyltransferase